MLNSLSDFRDVNSDTSKSHNRRNLDSLRDGRRKVCDCSDRVAFAVVGRDVQTRHRAKTVKSIRV